MEHSADLIYKYFPNLTELQKQQIERLGELYTEWNSIINVISRKDIVNLYERHVLHSLAIANCISFKPGAKVLDVGTGGGFPGIPLAILYPETEFTLIDSIGKKIKVVDGVAKALGLTNVIGQHVSVEHCKGEFDFIVSRAVTALPRFCALSNGKIHKKHKHSLPNGILYLKGGDFMDELKGMKVDKIATLYPLSERFEGEFFETKYLIHLPV